LEETVTDPSKLHLNESNWSWHFVTQNATLAHDSDDERDTATDDALLEHETVFLQMENYFCDIPS